MNLYKAHGVSPFGGCLPSLIQMPIWIALYSTLNYAVELYRAPFISTCTTSRPRTRTTSRH
jgi:YidC/Oxa1 family membrane protein insertase